MKLCEVCNKNIASQRHHCFSQSKFNRKVYPDYIDDLRNIQFTCSDCNSSHASPFLKHFNEIDFCKIMNIRPRTKTGMEIWKRLRYGSGYNKIKEL